MSHRRGMTLIEFLLSLALLAVVAAVGASWTTAIVRTQLQTQDQSAWLNAASRVFALIERDLLSVDRLDERGRKRTPRVQADGGILRIQTRRDGAAVDRRYVFGDRAGELRISWADQPHDEGAPSALGMLAACEAIIEPADETRMTPLLRVRLMHTDGGVVERVFLLLREDLE